MNFELMRKIRGIDKVESNYISFPVKFVPEVSENSVFSEAAGDSCYDMIVTPKLEEDLKKTLDKHFLRKRLTQKSLNVSQVDESSSSLKLTNVFSQ